MKADDAGKPYGIRGEIARYFEREAERLLGQARAASSLTTHAPLVGGAAEEAVRFFLRRHLPGRYGVGAGHVVSFHGTSAQADVVVFDSQDCFTVPIAEAQTLFSVEGVYAAVEVKASPTRQRARSRTLAEALANTASISSLTHLPFFMTGVPTWTRIADSWTVATKGPIVGPGGPVTAVLLLGTASRFRTIVERVKRTVAESGAEYHVPHLFCVLDERNFGLYGIDWERPSPREFVRRAWTETCETPGQTLALFLYWLLHKMVLDRVAEQPIFHNQELTAIWPSVMAPVIPRMYVDVSEDGHQWSWGWKKETRVFED